MRGTKQIGVFQQPASEAPSSSRLSRRVLPGEALPVPFNLSDSFLMNLQVESLIISLLPPATLLANRLERGLVYGNDSKDKVRILRK